MEELTIAQDVEFCKIKLTSGKRKKKKTNLTKKKKRERALPFAKKKKKKKQLTVWVGTGGKRLLKLRDRHRTCCSGTISDPDSAAHEHDPFDGVQDVRVNAHEERDVRQRTGRHDDGLGARAIVPDLLDCGGDGLDGGTMIVDARSHWIRVGRRKSFHAAEPVRTVDLRTVLRRPEEWCRRATIHLDVIRSRERVQASRGIYLGVLTSGVTVHLANRLAVVAQGMYNIPTVEMPRRCILVQWSANRMAAASSCPWSHKS